MTQSERQGAEPSPVPRSRLLSGLARAMRLVLIVAIGLLGWTLVQTCRDLFATPAPAPAPAVTAEAAAPRKAPDALPELGELLPGGWSLGDSTWSCATRQVAAAEVARCLQGHGEPVESGRRPADLERMVLNWLKKMARRRAAQAGLTEYQTLLGSGRVRAVSQGSGTTERLRLVQMLNRAAGGQWILYEIQPRQETRGAEGGQHLLPLPSGVASAARRWDRHGLGAELVGPASSSALAKSWRQAGWSVEQAGTSGGPGQGLVCRKGDETVLVWKWGPAGAVANEYLLLVPAASAARRGGS
jgi:hypothetical protein